MSSVVRLFGAVQTERRILRREGWGRSAWAWLAKAWRAHNTRLALAQLDERELSDVGISRAQAQFEASRPFWDLHRRA